MEPLSTAVATVVTKFIVDTGTTIAKQVGEKAADAARRLANAVLDKLGEDPAEAKTVERYKADPAAMQPSVDAAIKELVERDGTFAQQLQGLLDDYQEAAGEGIRMGDVGGGVQIGDNNVQIDRTTGNVTLNR